MYKNDKELQIRHTELINHLAFKCKCDAKLFADIKLTMLAVVKRFINQDNYLEVIEDCKTMTRNEILNKYQK